MEVERMNLKFREDSPYFQIKILKKALVRETARRICDTETEAIRQLNQEFKKYDIDFWEVETN